MGRNKLSAYDKIKNYQKKPYDIFKNNNPKEIVKFIRTIRSNVLRDLCVFNWARAEDQLFFIKNNIKDISCELKMSERKIYDLIKTTAIIEACGDIGFEKNLDKINKLSKEDSKNE